MSRLDRAKYRLPLGYVEVSRKLETVLCTRVECLGGTFSPFDLRSRAGRLGTCWVGNFTCLVRSSAFKKFGTVKTQLTVLNIRWGV
jgi:hypothetical protein